VSSVITKIVPSAKITSVTVKLASLDSPYTSLNKSVNCPSFPTASLSSMEDARPAILASELLPITSVKMTARFKTVKCAKTTSLAPSVRLGLCSLLTTTPSVAFKITAKPSTVPPAIPEANVSHVSAALLSKKTHA
jgi:hypothetical protein